MNRSQTRRPFSTVQSMLNTRPPMYGSRNYSSKNMSQKTLKPLKKTNLTANPPAMKRSQTVKNVKIQPEDASKSVEPIKEAQSNFSKTESNLQDLLKNTNTNIGALRSEIMRLENKCSKLETEKSRTEGELPYFKDYRNDLLKELKEENHKLSMADLKLKSDYSRIKEQNQYLETENIMYKEKLTNEKNQNELKEGKISQLRRDKGELERKLDELERMRAEKEKEKFKDVLEVRQKEEEISNMKEKLTYEREEKQRYMKDLQNELERNSRLQLDNEKLKVEGRGLVELIENLKHELQILKRNNEETLTFIRYS